MASLCCSPDARRHNYPLQYTVVRSKVKRVNTDCGVPTMTNDIPTPPAPLLLPAGQLAKVVLVLQISVLRYSSNTEADTQKMEALII